MKFTHRRSRLFLALAAAALTALAFALVPGAIATKGKPAAPEAPTSESVAGDTLLYRGSTTVALSDVAAGALGALGIDVEPVAPARAGKSGIRFPITFGVVDTESLAGQIRHAGGLKFSNQDGVEVYLTRFFIDVPTSLSGLVGGAPNMGDRADLFKLDLTNLTVDAGKRHIKLSGVQLLLTKGAADALNAAFSTSAFAEDLPIGTATVRARTWTKSV